MISFQIITDLNTLCIYCRTLSSVYITDESEIYQLTKYVLKLGVAHILGVGVSFVRFSNLSLISMSCA